MPCRNTQWLPGREPLSPNRLPDQGGGRLTVDQVLTGEACRLAPNPSSLPQGGGAAVALGGPSTPQTPLQFAAGGLSSLPSVPGEPATDHLLVSLTGTAVLAPLAAFSGPTGREQLAANSDRGRSYLVDAGYLRCDLLPLVRLCNNALRPETVEALAQGRFLDRET